MPFWADQARGIDLATLLLAVPILVIGLLAARASSLIGRLIQNLDPTAGFEPATRCLQIRIYAVRQVPLRVSKYRFVFGRQKFRADKYR